MATTPDSQEPSLNLREQIARIHQIQADIGQKLAGTNYTHRKIRFAPFMIAFTGVGAGAAFAKLFIN